MQTRTMSIHVPKDYSSSDLHSAQKYLFTTISSVKEYLIKSGVGNLLGQSLTANVLNINELVTYSETFLVNLACFMYRSDFYASIFRRLY